MANTWYKSGDCWIKPLDNSLKEGHTAVPIETVTSSCFPAENSLKIKYMNDVYPDNLIKKERDTGTRKGSPLYRLRFNKNLLIKLKKDYSVINTVQVHKPNYDFQFKFNKNQMIYSLTFINNGLAKDDIKHLKKDIYAESTDPKAQQKLLKKYTVRNPVWQKNFKNKLKTIWGLKCPVTNVNDVSLLIAAHIKPFAKSNVIEAFDKYNGILLTPSIDKLFELGYVSFKDTGDIIVSKICSKDILQSLGIDRNIKISFKEQHTKYLQWHRENKFKNNEE